MKMPKSLIYTLATIALIASTSFTALVSNFAAANQTNQSNPAETLAVNVLPTAGTKPESLSKSENVYIITNSDGTVNKSFINNTINTSSEPLPLKESITYSLDGEKIKAEDLIGKSGHVQITYRFTATKYHNDKLVPFLTVTGLTLDSAKFQNIQIDHGKIISESSSIILAGYTFAGLGEDLGTDILNNSFTITADVTNFTLNDSYTFATNELFADLDTTKLSSLDDVVNSINQLGTAFDQILAGSDQLATGANDLATGANQLAAGATELAAGANKLSSGINQANSGAHELNAGAAQLADGMNQLVTFNDSVINKIDDITNQVTTTVQSIIDKYHIDPNSPLIAQLNASLTEYYTTAYTAVTTYTGNIEKLSDGAIKLSDGLTALATGTDELATGASTLAIGANQLVSGANQLATGSTQLATGASTLSSGLHAFKEQGINKLLDFANNNLSTFTANLRSTINAAKSYHNYSNENAQSVKFIFKTPSLK